MNRLPKEVVQALNATGRRWTVEEGSKHMLIKLDGQLATVWPKGPPRVAGCATKNCVRYIRAKARALSGH